MSRKFDIVVIGGGPGGYVSAIRAAQLGFSVACIDSYSTLENKPALGGTCTNVGCIPSKSLLQSSEYFYQAKKDFHIHGIKIKDLEMDIEKFLERKNKIIRQNNEGIMHLFKKNKISFFHGKGQFVEKIDNYWLIKILNIKEEEVLGKNIIIATGSMPREFPDLPFDEERILSNSGALNINSIPETIGIIGAGVIGLELGSVWSRLGSEVSILESSENFLPALDRQIAHEARKIFNKQGLKIQTSVAIEKFKIDKNFISIFYFDHQKQKKILTVDKLIISIGRIPYTKDLNCEKIGLKIDEKGFILVNKNRKTNLDNVWAIGDVIGGPMLAHKAEEEGIAVVEHISGQYSHVNFNHLPWIIYTSPEIAWVGKNENELKSERINYKVGIFPFLANGRSRALGDTRGFVKIIADEKTDEVLGVHIIGTMASELISEATTIMAFKGSAEDIARICHAHPTLSESLKEAALAIEKRSINF